MNRSIPAAALAALLALASVAAAAPRDPTVALTLKDHRFTPAAIKVPAGVKVRIDLSNQDLATEEFDSHDLKVEQLVTPRGRTSFTIGPLKPGAYSFMGEFHPTTAQGRVDAS
ncbi:MAG TPA: cupredoxin domain-containing protein [Caulobacteraceae bacterium]|jgi:plastocyanin